MEVRIGKYILRSDRFCMWIDEEYEVKEGKTKGRKTRRRVAGYTQSFDQLLRDFVRVKHRDNDAKNIKELLEVFKKTAEDTELIKKTALKEDFKIIRQKAREATP